MGATKNNTGGHLKIRETGKNSNMRGHAKFFGGLKNRGGKAFRGPVTEGCRRLCSASRKCTVPELLHLQYKKRVVQCEESV